MITEDYVSFEMAKLLKKKGFDVSEIDAYFPFVYYSDGKIDFYDDDKPLFVCEAVTLQMAMKWLREVHNIDILITIGGFIEKGKVYFCSVYKNLINYGDLKEYSTYEEAVEAAIKYCLENLI